MKESYLVSDFRKTVAQRFGAQAGSLNAAFDAHLQALLKENAGESKEKSSAISGARFCPALRPTRRCKP